MPFFARPNLDDTQFKQLTGSTLTLSGETNFVGVLKSKGVEIDATTGGTTAAGDALVFDGTKIVLTPISGGSGSGIYYGASPTTCTVGGLPALSSISGCTISKILEKILVPELNPVIVDPSRTFNIPVVNPYEVGAVLNSLVATSTFNRGTITPPYGTDGYRSGAITCYHYRDFNNVVVSQACSISPATYNVPSYTVVAGSRTAYGCVSYSAGMQPSGSTGTPYLSPYPSGTTSPIPIVINGIYPYFYGKVASGGAPSGSNRPTPTAALITGGTKIVGSSTGTVYINFNSGADDYIWFATPNASTTKTCWYVDATNKGNIGGAISAGGNLFPNPDTVTSVGTVCWSGQSYKLYISNYQTCATQIMELRNS